jgi:hypothetical protein
MNESLVSPHPCQHLMCSLLWIWVIAKTSIVVFHCCFNMHFLEDKWCWASSHILKCHVCIFYDKGSANVFGPYFYQMVFFFLTYKIFLYCGEKNILSDISFANIFTQTEVYLFSLLIQSYAEPKVMAQAFSVISTNSSLNPRSSRFSPMSSSRSFVVLNFKFRLVICFG